MDGSHRVRRRIVAAVVAFIALATALIFAWQHTFIPDADLLFNKFWWVLILIPFLGLALAAVTKRQDPRVEGDKVLRHDDAAMLEHWTHGIGTVILLISGIALGCLFIPSLLSVDATNAMINIHFVGAAVFLFGSFYYLGNAILSPKRVREHLPTRNALSYTIRHYGLLIGIKRFVMPPEEKYFESERMAFILAVVATATIAISGIIKALAHVLSLPGALVGAATFLHDLMAIAMIIFIIPHVFFAVFAPGSFPLFISMLTGYLPLKHAEKDHAGWLEQLDAEGRGRSKTDEVPGAATSAASEAGAATATASEPIETNEQRTDKTRD